MKPKIIIGLILSISILILFAERIPAAKKPRHKPPLIERIDGAEPPEAYRALSPVMYESSMQPDCEDIHPETGYDHVIQHDQFGSTYYEYQRNGSMGRMIAVGPTGHRHMIFHETRGVYPPGPRWITYNCKDPLGNWLGATYADGGEGLNAGYGAVDVLHDGRAVLIYHRVSGTPPWATTLAVEDSVCGGYFANKYDLPDWLQTAEEMMWPKMGIVYDVGADIDYIHIAGTEGKTTGGNQRLGYMRCHFIARDTLFCETPNSQPGVVSPIKVAPNTPGCGASCPIAYFGECEDPNCLPGEYPNNIAVIVITSPVSQKVAIVFVNKKESGTESSNNDIFYFESNNNGYEWFPQYGGTWPPTVANGMVVNATQYPANYPERAYTDVGACYDYGDNLHIVWSSCAFDPATGLPPSFDVTLLHWVNTDPPGINNASTVASAYWDDGTYSCGAWNRNISKMSISAQDPIYHPGDPNSVFLFCTWTRFGPEDVSAKDFANGDIYAAVSVDGGQTWGQGFNLTGTNTDGCDPDADFPCLSEHWSSLAENMYDGHLHIQYVCDRDAGGAVVDIPSVWTDNDMMYLHIDSLVPSPPCWGIIRILDPPDWCNPPLKVLPGENRVIVMELENVYWGVGDYQVTTDNPNVVPTLNGSGYLWSHETKRVELTIFCQEEGFLVVKIFVHTCIGTETESIDTLMLHVVQSDDYYECDRDPATFIEKDNDILKLKTCVNTSQEVWDQRVADENKQKVIFSGAPIVATTWDQDTVVGRQDYRDALTGARDTIHNVVGIDPLDSNCALQVVWNHNTFICANNLPPPNHQRWWWIKINQQIFMWHDALGECLNWKKEQIIKQIWMNKGQYPSWWPNPPASQYEDIWFGYFADVDAPWDEGCHGCNVAGYDDYREMVWLHGWYNDTLPEGHPEYEDYYVGLTFTDRDGNVVAPPGMQCVLNVSFLYPQNGWGWKNGELYQLASTPGVNVHHPDSVADRSVVLTADMIPAGGDTLFESEFILIESFIQGDPGQGLTQLQAHIDTARGVLIPELDDLGVFSKKFPLCGDVNNDGIVNSADVVYLINYLFKGGPKPFWPINRADVSNDQVINSADIVYLINYLFKGGPPPNCPGFGRE